MRHDMTERFTEPRNGSKMDKFPRNTKKLSKKDEDGMPCSAQGMRRVHRYVGKYGQDYGAGTDFSIMNRFLMTNRDRPWDDVYAEICAEADARSYKGHHFRHWLEYMVEQNCTIDSSGRVCDSRGDILEPRWTGLRFYVHPETKLLKHIEPDNRRHKEPIHTVFEMEGKLYHCHQDIWYRVEMKPVPSERSKWGGYYMLNSLPPRDAFGADQEPDKRSNEHRFWYWSWWRAFEEKYGHDKDGKLWYCSSKQSANSREIAKLKKKYDL